MSSLDDILKAADEAARPATEPTPQQIEARAAAGDPAIWTILGETGTDHEGQRAVASVIANRMRARGATSAADVVTNKADGFEAWQDPKARARTMRQYPVGSPAYEAAQRELSGILTGAEPAPYPYTAFYGPKAQAAAGRQPPAWDDGTGVDVGGNRFFAHDTDAVTGDDQAAFDAIRRGSGAREAKIEATAQHPNPGQPSAAQRATANFLTTHGIYNENAPDGSSTHPLMQLADGVVPDKSGTFYVERGTGALRQVGADGDFMPYYRDMVSRQAVARAQPGLNRLITGAGQGLEDVNASANKLTGGGLAVPGAGDPIAMMATNPQDVRDMALGSMDDQRVQRNAFDLLHQGDPVVGSGRFAAQAVPAGLAAAAVPEIALPGAAAAGVDAGLAGGALRLGGNLLTNGARGVAATAPVVSTSDVPVGNQLLTGAVTGAALPPALGAVGRVATGAGNAVRGMVEPLTEGGREAIAGRMLRARAQGGNLLNPDLTEYVPGSRPTLAEALGNPGLATAQRAIGTNDVRFSNAYRANADAREAMVSALKGDPATREALVAARDQATSEELASVFANARPTDPSAVVRQIDETLAGRAGQRDAIRGPLEDIRAKLVKPDGTLQTDPELLWGVRQHIDDILSPLARGTARDGRAAARELLDVKQALDPVISQGAPGFMAWSRRYANMSQPINEFDFLQSLNLTTPRGQVTEGQVGSALKRVEAMRRAGGVNGAKSLSDDTLLGLRNLQADLQRQSNSELGRGTGSDTVQKSVERMASGADAVHPLIDLASAHAGPLGPLAVRGARGFYMGQRQRILDNYANLLLDPAAGLPALDEPVGNALVDAWSRGYRMTEPVRIPIGALGVNNLLTAPSAGNAQ